MKSSNASRNSTRTVLVVEDNPDDTLLLQVAAREICPDIDFRFVGDGMEALAYLKGEGQYKDRKAHPFPNVVLLDLRLPGMNGLQVLEQIRGLPERDGLKVLAWSDGADPDVEERTKQTGADCFIPKPVSYRELLDRVHRICEQARMTAD